MTFLLYSFQQIKLFIYFVAAVRSYMLRKWELLNCQPL